MAFKTVRGMKRKVRKEARQRLALYEYGTWYAPEALFSFVVAPSVGELAAKIPPPAPDEEIEEFCPEASYAD